MMAIGLVACSAAGAEPAAPSPPAAPPPADPLPAAHPADWRPLPAIARELGRAAAADGVTVDLTDAWGEPARGCYGVWLALHGGTAAAPALADQVLASLRSLPGAATPRELIVDNVVAPSAAAGVLAFGFTRAPYRGRVRAQLGSGRIAAVACFGNQREPARCDAECAAVIDGPAGRSAGAGAAPGATRGVIR